MGASLEGAFIFEDLAVEFGIEFFELVSDAVNTQYELHGCRKEDRTLLSWSDQTLCVSSWRRTLRTSRYGRNPS